MEKRSLIDLISGIAGGLLLVTAVVLFAVVPQDEPIPPTFQVSYVQEEVTIPLDVTLDFDENDGASRTQEVPVTIDSPYIYRISFHVEWTDDVVASDPDRFQFKIFEPEGDQVTDPNSVRTFGNNPPRAVQDNTTQTTTYEAVPFLLDVEKGLGAPPRDGPVPGATLTETIEEARARLLADLATYSPGDWSLEIYLSNAGDCPEASADPNADQTRFTACQEETGGSGDDSQNSIHVVSMTYTTYSVNIMET